MIEVMCDKDICCTYAKGSAPCDMGEMFKYTWAGGSLDHLTVTDTGALETHVAVSGIESALVKKGAQVPSYVPSASTSGTVSVPTSVTVTETSIGEPLERVLNAPAQSGGSNMYKKYQKYKLKYQNMKSGMY